MASGARRPRVWWRFGAEIGVTLFLAAAFLLIDLVVRPPYPTALAAVVVLLVLLEWQLWFSFRPAIRRARELGWFRKLVLAVIAGHWLVFGAMLFYVFDLLLGSPSEVAFRLIVLFAFLFQVLLGIVVVPGFSRALGFAPSVILVLAAVAANWQLLHPVPRKQSTVTLWTFADIHATAYQNAVPGFERAHKGEKVDVQLVSGVAVTSRLRAAFCADLDVPDLVEVEISWAGTFFRGREEEIGFIDWTPWLKETGYYDRIVKTRFAPYTCRGRIYGLPHDVHPVMLAYRRDLFEEYGIDSGKLETWDDFIREGRRVREKHGCYMIQLSDSSGWSMEPFLFQRDGGYFDAEGNLTMDSEIAFKTLKWYVPLVAGPGKIGTDYGGREVFTTSVEKGRFLTFICPDWRSKGTETHVESMAGKMALMPLPAFERGGRRTTTWGGTMLGITRKCRNKELAFALAEHLYLNPRDLASRFRDLNILPPLRDAWKLPEFNEPRPYWSNQPIGRMYAELAEQVPPQYTSPFINLAKTKMGEVVSACATFYNARFTSHLDEEARKRLEKEFDEFARARLRAAADYVREQMKRNPF
jgi:arabinosaccharide transport system substrate-binding protein